MNLYQMIFREDPFENLNMSGTGQLLKDILAFAGCVATLCPEISIKMEIKENIEKDLHVKGLWKVEAPYYLVFLFGREGRLYDECRIRSGAGPPLYDRKRPGNVLPWQYPHPGAEPAGMKAAIAVAFGYPKSLLYRDPATAKRLPLKRTLRV